MVRELPREVDKAGDEVGATVDEGCLVTEATVEKVVTGAETDSELVEVPMRN